MHEEDRKTMTDALNVLGLRYELLNNLKDEAINTLHSIIGWAASSPAKDKNDCEHTGNIEVGEQYYGKEDHQYTTYYFCEDCGEEMEDEG